MIYWKHIHKVALHFPQIRPTLTEISHMLSHVKISHVKSICGIGTLHM